VSHVRSTIGVALTRWVVAGFVLIALTACGRGDSESWSWDEDEPNVGTIQIGSEAITVEIAQSDDERASGLSGRTELPEDRGMLFVYDSPRVVTFWMRGMLIPIDMVFLRDQEVISVIADVPPCAEDPCPTYGPDVPVDAVLELAAGRAATLGVTPGLTIPIPGK
jgi:uncharacterized protein